MTKMLIAEGKSTIFTGLSDDPIPGEGVSITDAFKILTMPVKKQINVTNSI